MKTRIIRLLLAAVLAGVLASASCLRLRDEGELRDVWIRCSAFPVKSMLSADEIRIDNLNVYVYRDGYLDDAQYTQGDKVRVMLDSRFVYGVYVLANTGRIDPPIREDELSELRYEIRSAGDLGGVLPMSYYGPGRLGPGMNDEIEVTLTRLVSRWDVCFETDMQKCSFRPEAVLIRNAAMDVTPFAPSSVPLRVSDGDGASALDIEKLSRGETVTFYTLENAGGVLLPDNDNPWKKTPEEIGEAASRCTYLSLSGRWTTPGAECTMSFNCYLGMDNCSDFNVLRNTHYKMALIVGDEATIRSSWKIFVDDFEENRRISFGTDTLPLRQGGFWNKTAVSYYPEDMPYLIYPLDERMLADASVSVEYDGDTVKARSYYAGEDFPEVRLKASSWDGRVTDTLVLRVTHEPGDYLGYRVTPPKYVNENGFVSLYEAGGDEEVWTSMYPVQRWSWGGSDFPAFTYYVDKDGVFTVKSKGSPGFWYTSISSGATYTVKVCKGEKSSDILLGPLVSPGIVYDPPYVKMTDEEGNILDLSRFILPDGSLDESEITPSEYFFSQVCRTVKVHTNCEDLTWTVRHWSEDYEQTALRENNGIVRIDFRCGKQGRTIPVRIEVYTYGGEIYSTDCELRF